MKALLPPALLLSLATAPASAELIWTHFSLSWYEVNAATHNPVPNPNGIVEPGEAARIAISVSFTPVGTIISPGQTVVGFAEAPIGIGGSVPGSVSNHTYAPGFSGTPLFPPDLSIYMISQPDPPLGAFPIATNPVSPLRLTTWTPLSYSNQTATIRFLYVDDIFAKLFIHYGTDPQGNPLIGRGVAEQTISPPIFIPIAPAPPFATPLLLALFTTRRRRRNAKT